MSEATYSGPYAAAFGATHCHAREKPCFSNCPAYDPAVNTDLWAGKVALSSPAPSEDSADRKAAEVSRSPERGAERSPLRTPDSEVRPESVARWILYGGFAPDPAFVEMWAHMSQSERLRTVYSVGVEDGMRGESAVDRDLLAVLSTVLRTEKKR